MSFHLGLTGSFGSGKSTVSAILREAGAVVIDADALAHEAVEPGQPALAEVVRQFGSDLLDEQGRLRRKALGERIFADRAAVRRLEAIIHPYVRVETERQLARLADHPLVVLDVPLLFEVGMERLVDKVLVVTITENQRFLRLRQRGFGEREIISRLGRQMAQARKVAQADYLIDNSGTIASTRKQVQSVLEEIQKEKSQGQ